MIPIVRTEKDIREIVFAAILALIIACGFLNMGNDLFTFLFFSFYVYLLFKHPDVALFVAILVINDCFSLMDKDILRMPGLFRIKDIFFISVFLPLAIRVFSKKSKLRQTVLSKAVWAIIIFTAIEFLYTILVKGQGANYTFRMGRRYLYYLLFFPMVYLIDDDTKFKRFLRLLTFAGISLAVLMVTQYLLGPATIIFKYASVVVQDLSSQNVLRSYVSGGNIVVIVFYLFLYRLLFDKKDYIVNILALILVFLGGVYLNFSRANIFGVIAGAGFALLIFLKSRKTMKIIISFAIFIIFLSFLLEGMKFYFGDSILNPVSFIFKHLETGLNDLIHQSGTFGFRLKDSAARMLLIKNNFLFGVGFIHPESRLLKIQTLTPGIITSDSGIITLLLDFGVGGLIWLTLLTAYFFKESKKAYKLSNDNFTRILILAAFSFYFSRLFSFLTLTDFVEYEGIVSISIALFMVNYAQKTLNDGTLNSNS